MYVCICNAVTDREVRECAQNGARTVEDLSLQLGVATCCGRCRESVETLLTEQRAAAVPCPA